MKFLSSIFPSANLRELVSGSIWIGGGQFLAMTCGFLSGIILARTLSAQELGVYFLLIAFLGFFLLVAQFGAGQTLVKLLPTIDDPPSIRHAVKKIWIFVAATSLVTSLLLYWLMRGILADHVFHAGMLRDIAGVAAILLFLSSMLTLTSETFRGLRRPDLATLFGAPSYNVIFLICIFTMWSAGVDATSEQDMLVSVLFAAALGYSVVLCFGLPLLVSRVRKTSFRVPQSSVRVDDVSVLISQGGVFMGIAIINYLASQADIWVIGYALSEGDVALYGIGSRLALLVALPLLVANTALAPLVTRQLSVGQRSQAELYARGVALASLVPAGALFLLYAVLGEQLLVMLYGEQYRASYPVLLALSAGQLVNVWSGPCGLAMIAGGVGRKLLVVISITAGLTLILALFASPYLHLGTLAWIFAVGTAMQYVGVWYAARRWVGIHTHALTLNGARNALRARRVGGMV